MATAAAAFGTLWRAGKRVQQTAAPHRKGTIARVAGAGPGARVTVNFDGWHPLTLSASQLRLI